MFNVAQLEASESWKLQCLLNVSSGHLGLGQRGGLEGVPYTPYTPWPTQSSHLFFTTWQTAAALVLQFWEGS